MATIVGTFGFTGYLRPAPGTWGSLAAALLWWFVVPANLAVQLVLIVVAGAAGIWSGGVIERRSGLHDPSIVVIDEVAGMWLALLVARQAAWYFLTAFILFRLLDVLKPGPIRRLQSLPAGWGVVMDDLAAGGIVLVLMLVIRAVL